jgi:uncharacterized membrane protein
MGMNFVRNYVDRRYPASESSAIRHWYLETTERWSFFRELEKQAPGFGDVQKETMKAAGERKKTEELYIQKLFKAEKEALDSLENGKAKRHEARRERKEKRDRDREGRASMRRLERARSASMDSMSSVETAIWNPLSPGADEDPTTPTTENGGPILTHSQPIDSSDLIDLLKALAIHEANEEEFHETMEYIPPDLTSPTKLKLKNTSHSVPKEKKYKASRHAMHGTDVQHGLLADKAFATLAEVRPSQPQSDTNATENTLVHLNESVSPEGPMTLSPKYEKSSPNRIYTTAIESGKLFHQTLGEELASINDAIDRMAARQQTKDGQGTDVRELDGNVLEDADGLVYLQPAVYGDAH